MYKAIHFPTMRRVAIKKIPKDFGRTHEYANSFARELRNLYHNVQQLSARVTPKPGAAAATTGGAWAAEGGGGGHCPYLLTLYDAYVERNPTNLCLVLEFMEGGSLEQVVVAGAGAGGCDDEGFIREVSHNVLKVRPSRFLLPRWSTVDPRRISTPHTHTQSITPTPTRHTRAFTTSTSGGTCTRTSSRGTCCSPRTASPSWPTSGSPWRSAAAAGGRTRRPRGP